MGFRQIRIGQLINTFGPGSIYIDREGSPILIGGLDHWFKEWDDSQQKMIQCSDIKEFEFYENRLSDLLKVNCFRRPPDYRSARIRREKPQNGDLHIPAVRFPSWYRNTSTSEMRKFNLHTQRTHKPSEGRWQPIRFISVCGAGHIGEFPWKKWMQCNCIGDNSFFFKDRGGQDLSSIEIKCDSCKKKRNLTGGIGPLKKGEFPCHGSRPWLGTMTDHTVCKMPLTGALINQTNIYFPLTISSIYLPDLMIEDDEIKKAIVEIEKCQDFLPLVKTLWRQNDHNTAITLLKTKLEERELIIDDELIKSALESMFRESAEAKKGASNIPSEPESELVRFKREEFNIIRNKLDEPEHFPNLRIIRTETPKNLNNWIERVNLVDRLCETKAFFGFSRIAENFRGLQEMPDSAMNQLFRYPPRDPMEKWLPAIQVFGEGIYIELREDAIKDWQKKNEDWLQARISEDFRIRMLEESKILSPVTPLTFAWASRYLMVHSLAHILINQLVFSCGYSTASLRERLYVSEDSNAPMAGIMIFTAAGDAEGTLGGLVKLGKPENLGDVFLDALKRASWCSADPVCSDSTGGRGSKLINLAACHACTLLPETSCETINNGLDRAMLVGTPYDRTTGFMSDLLNEKNIFE